jgi:carbamoyl-phosphate synthase large subunit
MNKYPAKVLVTSSSKKIPLIMIVKEAAIRLNPCAVVVAGDISDEALSAYVADEFWMMPRSEDANLFDILAGVKERGINYIFPTRDGELKFWSQHAQLFADQGILVVTSPINSIERCIDKLRFSNFGKEQYLPVIESAECIDDLTGEYFVVKERFGAGSKNIGIRLNRIQANEHSKLLFHPIYQPFISGREFSADVWADSLGKVKGIVLRNRVYVVDGESQVTTTFSDQLIEGVIEKTIEKLCLRGPVVVQAILADDNSIHIIECNARFGGASTAGVAAGLDSIYWSLLEGAGHSLEKIPFKRTKKEIKQIRVPSDIYL